jgi:glycosyltransferase involved in cell wall biosynthesis
MKIDHFVYDDIDNPWCGGGGTYRAVEINRRISKDNEVRVYSGNFPGAKSGNIDGVHYVRLGLGWNYAVSRFTFTVLANLLWPFLRTDLLVNEVSVFSPVFSFAGAKSRVFLFYHVLGKKHLEKFPVFGHLFRFIEKMFVRWTRNVVAISQSASEKIMAESPGKKNIRVILSGYDQALLNMPFKTGEYVLYFGRFDFYMKGIDILLDAFSAVLKKEKNARLTMAGHASPGDVKNLLDLVKQRNLDDNVKVVPNPDNEKRAEFLSNARFLVMPSRFEGWGIVAVEGAAAGKLCIGSDIEGLRDAIKNGESGFLVEPENSEKLSEKIIQLLENPGLYREHFDLCKKWAKRFSWDRIAEEQMDFYKAVASGQ